MISLREFQPSAQNAFLRLIVFFGHAVSCLRCLWEGICRRKT